MAAFDWQMQVRFRHCDPAGIVFYPRFFEMANDLVETFFADAVGWAFHDMHGAKRMGVPMRRIEARFSRACRIGDVLDWRLTIGRLGRSSADLLMQARSGGELRLEIEGTIVVVDLDAMKSLSWPEDIRAKLATYIEERTS